MCFTLLQPEAIEIQIIKFINMAGNIFFQTVDLFILLFISFVKTVKRDKVDWLFLSSRWRNTR